MRHQAGATRFWIDTAKLVEAIGGEPAEVSEIDGRCRLIVNGPDSSVIYFDSLGAEQTCKFPTRDLVHALQDALG